MSMISEQVNELKLFARKSKELGRMVDMRIFKEAADTIETLSAKLSAANMERSERYYGGGWIACNNGENLPKEAEHNALSGWSEEVRPSDYVLCKAIDGNIFKGFYSYVYKTWEDFKEVYEYDSDEITEWQPLPQPHKPDKE